MREVGNYVPSAVEVSLFGVQATGFSPTNVVTIEKEEQSYTFTRAQDGSATATLDKFAPYRVTIHLMSTSSTNTWFHLIYKLFENYGVEFKMPLLVKDTSGDTSFFATDVFFETVPPRELSSEIQTVEWSFICFNPVFTHGSNVEPNQIIETLNLLHTALRVANMFGVDVSGFGNKIKGYADEASSKLKEMF